MKKKIVLNKRDFHRALLTDVMPYEVPFILTNEGFYYEVTKNKLLKNGSFLHWLFMENNSRHTKPIIYNIVKDSDDDSERKLYLIHPCNQISICDLYKNYRHLIFHMCNKSSYSLRHPSKIADEFYYKSHLSNPEEKFKDENVNIENNGHSDSPAYASAFFDYKDFSFLYKFYDSYQFHQIEKKFNKLFKFDIAKCFSSISTHELSRAIRGTKEYYKSKDLHSFELTFEKIISASNFGETHGIIVGPEFARIFAEILLQAIDAKVKKSLTDDNIAEGRDYVIKRYVDDYFIFYNDDKIRKKVHQQTLRELENHKLFSNESKNKTTTIPFMTGITVAKQNLNDLISELFNRFDTISTPEVTPPKMGMTKKIISPHKKANKLITDIKSIVYSNDVTYSKVSGYFFTLIRNKVSEIDEHTNDFKDSEYQCDQVTNFLLIILEISFFVHAMDFRVRSTFLISQTIIIINRISKSLGHLHQDTLKRKIFNETYASIKHAIQRGAIKDIETLNLIIAIRDIDESYMLPQDVLAKIIIPNESPSYFNLMTGLYYIRNNRSYLKIKKEIIGKIISKFNDELFTIYNDAELVHILFDSISCPYIRTTTKKQITKQALAAINITDIGQISYLVNIISKSQWFIDWRTPSSDMIERLLLKKELKTTYGS